MKIKLITTTIIAALAIGACGSSDNIDADKRSDGSEWLDDTSDKAPTTTRDYSPPTTSGEVAGYFDPETQYVDALRSDSATFIAMDRDGLIDLGYAGCDLINEYDGDMDSLLSDIAFDLTVNPEDWGYADAGDIGLVFHESVKYLCPEWDYLID